MKRSIIRWPGLAAFAAIVGLLVIVSWLFLDAILKVTLEYGLGRLNGAEVNIQKVEHKWSPLTLTATMCRQPTRPNHPTTKYNWKNSVPMFPQRNCYWDAFISSKSTLSV